jgi:hypothetical protein
LPAPLCNELIAIAEQEVGKLLSLVMDKIGVNDEYPLDWLRVDFEAILKGGVKVRGKQPPYMRMQPI